MAKNNDKRTTLKVVPPTEVDPLPPDQQQLEALSQQLQATRTELAVLKQMYAEVSVQGRIAMAEREQLLMEVQRAQSTIEKLTDELAKTQETQTPATTEEAEKAKED